MGIEIKTISKSLRDLASLDDLIFSDTIDSYVYGLSGFSLSYTDGDRHDVWHVEVSASVLKPAGADNRLSLTIQAKMDDNDKAVIDRDSSWVTLTVIAFTGSNNGYVALGNTLLQASGTPVQIEPGTNSLTALPLLAGIKVAYSDGDHQVNTVSATASLTMSGASGVLTPSAAMADNGHNTAGGQADAGYLCTLDRAAGIASARLSRKQTTTALTCDLGVPLTACAVMMASFTVCYAGGDAHQVNTIRVGAGTGAGSLASVSSANRNVVNIPCAQSKMWSDGHDDYSDDGQSNVDLIVIGLIDAAALASAS